MLEEHRITISSSTTANPDEIARRTFPTVRKGYDPSAVRTVLEIVAEELRAAARRESDLREALQDAERRAKNPELDEAGFTAALGAETARVLQTAHEAAHEVVARAEATASQRIADSVHSAALRIEQAELAAGKVQDEAAAHAEARIAGATRDADDLVAVARLDADGLVEATKAECRGMVRDARQVRARILRDLNERRRALHLQVEQLLAGRATLMEAVDSVRGTVDDLTERLERAETEARAAAGTAVLDLDAMDQADALVAEQDGLELEGVVESDEVTEQDVFGAGGDGVGEDALAGPQAHSEPAVAAVPPEPGAAAAPSEPAVAAALPASTTTGAGDEDVTSPPRNPAVESLFAKIRAGRAERTAQARRVLESADEPAAGGGAEGAPADEGPVDELPADELPARDEMASAGELDAGGETTGVAEDPLAVILSRRDELLGPVVNKLARSIKRALQDDQNELLDRIRQASSTTTLDELLTLREQEDRFEAAAREAITEARQSGVKFAEAAVHSNGSASASADTDEAGQVAESSHLLAVELVGALRQRIGGGLSELAGIRDAAVPDLIGSAYREWKSGRVEEIAGDHATRAFSGGQVAALQADDQKVRVTWLVDDGGLPCPDCDDNALAGPQAPGEPFPTGQLHPPVHPGCRCLLVAEP